MKVSERIIGIIVAVLILTAAIFLLPAWVYGIIIGLPLLLAGTLILIGAFA